MESIAIFYTPLASTKLAASIGFAIASHMAVVYTNNAGQSFGVSAGPSIHLSITSPAQIVDPIVASAHNTPAGFGVLMADPANNHAFIMRRPEDYYTQDSDGEPYPSAMVARGSDLAGRWQRIVQAYSDVSALKLTYSPISQNSNSIAGTALRAAGLRIPFSSSTPFVPAVFNRLPLSAVQMKQAPGY